MSTVSKCPHCNSDSMCSLVTHKDRSLPRLPLAYQYGCGRCHWIAPAAKTKEEALAKWEFFITQPQGIVDEMTLEELDHYEGILDWDNSRDNYAWVARYNSGNATQAQKAAELCCKQQNISYYIRQVRNNKRKGK